MTKELYKDELVSLVSKGALLIDVRELEDHEEENGLPGHTHMPLSRLGELASRSDSGQPLIFYCRCGLLSYQAAEIATHWTDQPVYYLAGGLLSYHDDA